MLISYNWLKEFINTKLSPKEIGEALTSIGLEVEGIDSFESVKGSLNGLSVGKVLDCFKHPKSEKLKITKVDIGDNSPIQIVCGAPNVDKNQTVVVATVGTTLFNNYGEPIKIKKSKFRGELSEGMICGADEIGMGEKTDGIMLIDSKHKAGTQLNKVFSIYKDKIFNIGLTPNRSDAMSHLGVARDLRAFLLKTSDMPTLITPPVSSFHVENNKGNIQVEVVDSNSAPRYCGVRISGVKVKESPKKIKDKLKAIGVKPINNIVDITNYVLHELGQPLHAFDVDKIKSKIIRVQKLKSKTKLITLDGIERELDIEDLVICDGNKPICLAGVFGGLSTGVNEYTKEVFIESAYFEPKTIRKTAKRHGLNTDASFRYERSIDIELVKYALKRAAILIQEIAGGFISSDIFDNYPNKIKPTQVVLKFEYMEKLIGFKIPNEDVKKILHGLDIKIYHASELSFGLEVPSYRYDVRRPADIVEEILRIYGYNSVPVENKIKISIPNFEENSKFNTKKKIANHLVSKGFYEVYNNSITSELQNNKNSIKIINPLSTETSEMRNNLIFGLLKSIEFNINRQESNLNLFEFGSGYKKSKNNYNQIEYLTIATTGFQHIPNWISEPLRSDFFFVKGIVGSIFERMGLKIQFKISKNPFYYEFIEILSKEIIIGEIGKIKSNIYEGINIEQDVFIASIKLDKVQKILKNKLKVESLSKYPRVQRDISIIIDDEINFEQIKNVTKQCAPILISSIELFDEYKGKGIPSGKKSYALAISLIDKSKTLTEKIIEKTISKIIKKLIEKLGATLRE